MASSPQCGLVSYRLVNSTWLANESEALCTYLTFHDTVALLLAAAFLVALALSLPCGLQYTCLLFALLCTSAAWEVGVPVVFCAWTACCVACKCPRLRLTVEYAAVPTMPQIQRDDVGI